MTTNNNYGIGSTHNFKKEIEDTLRPAMERQTRADMQTSLHTKRWTRKSPTAGAKRLRQWAG